MWSRSSRDIKWAIPKKSLNCRFRRWANLSRQWPQHAEWERIQPCCPWKPVGKQREVNLRSVLNAIFYRADNGIKWRPARWFSRLADCVWLLSLWCAWASGSRLMPSWSNSANRCRTWAHPSLVIIDSQVRIESKGRKRGLMVTRRWKAQASYCRRCPGISRLLRQRRERCRC